MSKENPSQLEKLLLDGVESNTPEDIKTDKIFDYDNKNKFTFTLTKDLVEKLELRKWFDSYKKEAMVSTAGIRGPQNVLYPHDTRFPINTIGITLATLAKALVLKEKYPNDELIKLVGCEVRYNSKTYLDIIARIQSALGIRTLTPLNRQTIPIWLASFLAFKLDLVGAEYITSSHGISVKNATKDLNNQGSQFLPDESIEFVNKIEEILNTVDKDGEYRIDFEASENDLIDEKTMQKLNNGIDLYVEYLKNGVANQKNIELIKNFDKKIVIDAVGGAAYNTLSKILEKLGIQKNFDWLNTQEDPFFHSIGKDIKDGKFYDWSLDITVVAKNKEGREYFPVVESLKYDEKLKNYPIGTVCLVTDPDHDRLSVVQIEDIKNKAKVNAVGVDTIELDNERILCVFSANQAFLMIMDFWTQMLKESGDFDKHKRFIIKTTASSKTWDEWAKHNGIAVINTPVGFKEIANATKKIEYQIEQGVKDIKIKDIFAKTISLGDSPRMIFGGEESGGMIIGAQEIIKSLNGRCALAMREKSATEAIIVTSALVASLDASLWEHLARVYDKNNIVAKYDVREDIAYYNESEPNIEKLKEAKKLGEGLRTKNDIFYLALAIGMLENKITLENVKEILSSTFKNLDFSNLSDVKFVGDGTYFDFTDKFVEIRPSGTDAKTKAYAGGANRDELFVFAKTLGNYSGDLSEEYKKYLSEDYVNSVKEKSLEVYEKFARTDEDKREFKIPNYKDTFLK
ncbi:TPA: hypothetical protein IAA86_06015 [Candidatus Galligastranaerophilus intestinavium]|uniref:Phosphomannomutase n=1 Tax=Candidatus Galligastranaerophilus intestinavium TaxID=2840836 RepID=A0A9D1JXZ3_9BACT|nr:hypothetical protein [Candidatus Galligastranaerophilus intestinavium]